MKGLKFILVLIIFILSATLVTSCGEKTNSPSQDNHICSFSSTWSKNDSKHWKECSCGKRSEEANHSFGEWQEIEQATTSKEGLKEQDCSICTYKKQEKINKVEPIYSWISMDLLQPNIIMGGTSSIVLDENGNKVEFSKLVDRQIDMLAQEIISRLEYVYGDTNKNETYAIKDNLNNVTFTTYNSMNVFSESLDSSKEYPVYRYLPYPRGSSTHPKEDPYIEEGYIEMQNGEMVEFDSKIHSHYITLNDKRYAAICSENVAGNFTSETSLQYTFETLGAPTIYHKEMKYTSDFLRMYHAKLLTFQNAIYGTPTWKYEKKGNIQYYYAFSYNTDEKTMPWNWSEAFRNGTVSNKLKTYIAYILANRLKSYNELPSEEEIINAKYTDLLKCITFINNYIIDYKEIILNVISNRIIGTKIFENDIYLGNLGDDILKASYLAASSSYYEYWSGRRHYNWETGLYDLYQVPGCGGHSLGFSNIYDDYLNHMNKLANTSFSVNDMAKVYDYKAYDVIVKGILNQISKQTDYLFCNSVSYEQKSISSSISSTLDETEVYFFFKSKTTNEVRICLDVPFTTEVKLVDKDGKEVSFTKENLDGKLALKINGSKLPNSSNFNSTILNDVQGYGATSSLEEKLQG
ncbi:MAG: hypothetical protein NC310_04915 [Roseburia sp.]|nr:hypothetical protein [Anaeroplasma bactoclasticum]MCM1196401.1 hypothetical protein [Roseburia sp.]MCM1556329.1 hypothetical protein [Anaeroplasma bactoclasticum]